MSRYKEYENSLRKIILSSADVLKDEVITYLEKVADSNDSIEIEQVLKNSHNLVDYIPHELSDFIANVLIWKPSSPVKFRDDFEATIYTAKSSYLERPSLNFGVKDDWDYELFTPPAHIHSPFFYLLSKNESAGLNLVHVLTNAATDRWHERLKNQRYEDPDNIDDKHFDHLPIKINLSSGVRDFWGDLEVYCWYRGITNNAPDVIISALMALEVWMGKQVESGREPENLFEIVLSKSNSVAILAICVSITLAYPNKCLRAALPLVSNPALWDMDISRSGTDRRGRFKMLITKKDWVYKILEEHDNKPHRKTDIRCIAADYIFCSDDSLRMAFEQAIDRFIEDLPFMCQEDRNNPAVVSSLRESMQGLQAYGKRENYKIFKEGNGNLLKFELPKDIQKRNAEKLAFNSQSEQWYSMENWSHEVLKGKREEQIQRLEEMIESAKQFHKPNDFNGEALENYYENTRLAAITNVVAASLILDSQWIVSQGLLEWSQNILLSASHSEQPLNNARALSKPNISAAKGLTCLVSDGIANLEIRQEILRLVGQVSKRFAYAENKILQAIFYGLQKSWSIDPILCWNALSLCISLSVTPTKFVHGTPDGEYGTSYEDLELWENNIIQNHIGYLESNKIPKLPQIPIETTTDFSHFQIQYCLYDLPLNNLCQDVETKNIFLKLSDELIARTISENLTSAINRHSQPREWNNFILNWVTYFANSLKIEEIRHHILKPLQDNWNKIPELMAYLLYGFITNQIYCADKPNSKSLEIWKEICNWILDII